MKKAPAAIKPAGAFCSGIALTLGVLSSRALSFRAIWTNYVK
jgi:hypothetical protein